MQVVLQHCCKTSLNSHVARFITQVKKNFETSFVGRHVRKSVVKPATSLFNSFCSNVAKQVARFFVARFTVALVIKDPESCPGRGLNQRHLARLTTANRVMVHHMETSSKHWLSANVNRKWTFFILEKWFYPNFRVIRLYKKNYTWRIQFWQHLGMLKGKHFRSTYVPGDAQSSWVLPFSDLRDRVMFECSSPGTVLVTSGG